MDVRVTHVGTATVILEFAGLRLLTDPAFDAEGTAYRWAPVGGRSTKLESPALAAADVGAIDAVLVTHAQHDDNLDPSGRALLAGAARVLTTRPSARRLGGNAEGLRDWQTTEVGGVKITATPARHGPPGSLPFVGKVIGFVLEHEGATIYISGDTVLFGGVAEVARRFRVGLALLHCGEARLPVMGPFRLTMNGAQAARAATMLGAETIVPIHYDGWTHFREPRAAAEAAFAAAGLTDRVRWLDKGAPTTIAVRTGAPLAGP